MKDEVVLLAEGNVPEKGEVGGVGSGYEGDAWVGSESCECALDGRSAEGWAVYRVNEEIRRHNRGLLCQGFEDELLEHHRLKR